jgi:hypothetical protein
MGEMIDDVEMDVRDEDEEMKEWEEAQIRREGESGQRIGESSHVFMRARVS